MKESSEPAISPDAGSIVVAQHILAADEAGVALPVALRAAASQADSRRLARTLRELAAAVERGQSLADALAMVLPRMPADVRGLMAAGQRVGNLPGVVSEWIDNRRLAQAHWREVMSALAYPAILSVLTFGVFLFICWMVVPTMRELIEGFGLKVPVNTRAIFWCSDYGANLACGLVVIGAVMALGLRLLGGKRLWSRVITALPLLGDLWHWSGVAEMLRGLQVLLENRVPLPDALQLAGDSLPDRHVGHICRRLGEQIEQGQDLTTAIDDVGQLPQSILPLLRAGERQGNLPEALQLAAQALETRLRLHSSLIVALGPPLLFVLLASIIGGMYGGLMVPLMQLLQGLS